MNLENIILRNWAEREIQILHGLTYMWNLTEVEFIGTENRRVVARD
jgi:hypothetical protein